MQGLIVRALRQLFVVAAHDRLKSAEDNARTQSTAALALAPLAAPPARFVPWTRPSLTPRSLATALNDVALHDRRYIVELGGGVSTLYLARLLTQRGDDRAALVTVEHDEAWSHQLEGALEAEGLERWVRVVTAPLVPCLLSVDPSAPGDWYDVEILGPALDAATPEWPGGRRHGTGGPRPLPGPAVLPAPAGAGLHRASGRRAAPRGAPRARALAARDRRQLPPGRRPGGGHRRLAGQGLSVSQPVR